MARQSQLFAYLPFASPFCILAVSGYNFPMRITLYGGPLIRRCYQWKKWATADA
ncbi:MAG: hypothetical protein ACRDH2_00650 [Anaerolineales bacterium]